MLKAALRVMTTTMRMMVILAARECNALNNEQIVHICVFLYKL